MKQDNYILWLPSWYPNKLSPYNGDFVQRHAHAVSLYEKIKVVFIVRDEKGVLTKDILIERSTHKNLEETIIYYHTTPFKIKPLDKLNSFRKYKRVYENYIEDLFEKYGKPSLVHVYITMKAGLIGLWLHKKYKLPYVVAEQWTIYLPEARPNFYDLPFFFQRWAKKILNNAVSLMVVSQYLGDHMKDIFRVKHLQVIPNVVNLEVFKFAEKPATAGVRFIHISTLNYQKNIECIFTALASIKRKGYKCILDVIGPENREVIALAEHLELKQEIIFHVEMPQKQLVSLMQAADALVLYSRYETFGCVLIEAHACGLPVIVADIPVMHENVQNHFNGLFAAGENTSVLAGKMIDFINQNHQFNRKEIAAYAAAHYNYKNVGKMISDWYYQAQMLQSSQKKYELPTKSIG